MSQTSKMPCAPLEYERMIVQNRPWPDVSHSCSFTRLPSRRMVVVLYAVEFNKNYNSIFLLKNIYLQGFQFGQSKQTLLLSSTVRWFNSLLSLFNKFIFFLHKYAILQQQNKQLNIIYFCKVPLSVSLCYIYQSRYVCTLHTSYKHECYVHNYNFMRVMFLDSSWLLEHLFMPQILSLVV